MGLIKVRCNVTGYRSFEKDHVYFAEDNRKVLRKAAYLHVFRCKDRKPVWVCAEHFTVLENNMSSALNKFKPTDVVTIIGRSPLEVYEVTGYGGTWANTWINLKPLTVEARKRGAIEAQETNLQLVPKPSVYELIGAIKNGRQLRLLSITSSCWVTVKDPSISTLLDETNVWFVGSNSQPVPATEIPSPLDNTALEHGQVVYIPSFVSYGAAKEYRVTHLPDTTGVYYKNEDDANKASKALIDAIRKGAEL